MAEKKPAAITPQKQDDDGVLREAVRDLVFLSSRLETFARHLLYNPRDAKPSEGAKFLALTRITRAAWSAYVTDDTDALARLEKASRVYLEGAAEAWRAKSGQYSVDLKRFAPAEWPGWLVWLGDVIPQKGSASGRTEAIRVTLRTLERSIRRAADGSWPGSAAEDLGHQLAMYATMPMGPVVDFLAEREIRFGAMSDSEFDALAKRLSDVCTKRLETSSPPGSHTHRPRELAARCLADAMRSLGAPADAVDALIRYDA